MTTGEGPGSGLARRLVVATVLALLLGGTTTLAVRYLSTPQQPVALPSPTAPAVTDPPVAPLVVDPVASPSPSTSPSASHRPAPRPRPQPTPTSSSPSPSPSHVPMYQAPKGGLCKYVDFTALKSIDTLAPDDKPEVVSGTKPGEPGQSPFYTCLGGVGNVGIRLMGIEIYHDRATAAIGYVDTKAIDAPTDMDPIRGLGDDGYGFFNGAPTNYKVTVLSRNMVVQLAIQHPNPHADTFRAAAVATVRSILQKLPVS
jgi:hypothetical protein